MTQKLGKRKLLIERIRESEREREKERVVQPPRTREDIDLSQTNVGLTFKKKGSKFRFRFRRRRRRLRLGPVGVNVADGVRLNKSSALQRENFVTSSIIKVCYYQLA